MSAGIMFPAAALVSFAIAALIAYPVLTLMRKLKAGQTVLAFGTQMVLVAEVVVALACGIALPLPLGGTGGRPDGGRRLPDRAGRGGHTGDGGRERAAFCGHLRGEGGSDAQKAEDAQQAERLAIHDGTSWSGQKGRENSHLEGWPRVWASGF